MLEDKKANFSRCMFLPIITFDKQFEFKQKAYGQIEWDRNETMSLRVNKNKSELKSQQVRFISYSRNQEQWRQYK